MTLAGCQKTPAPQSVADSQRPPSSALRHMNIDILRGRIKAGDFLKAEISSVVLLRPNEKIYAYCVRTMERAVPGWSYLGIALKNDRIIDSTEDDYRCHDKRLRYYNFPELLTMTY
jgi:hypothetical protein